MSKTQSSNAAQSTAPANAESKAAQATIVSAPKVEVKKTETQIRNIPGEIITSQWVVSVVAIDAKQLALDSDQKKFCYQNRNLYYVAINSWLLLAQEASGDRLVHDLIDYIKRFGLVQTVRKCDEVASRLISCTSSNIDMGPVENFPWSIQSELGCIEDLRTQLQILRYLKRLSPCQCTKLNADALELFLQRNSDMAEANRNGNEIPYLESRISHYLSVMLKDFPKFIKQEDPSFSSGACQDSRILAEKIAQYAKYNQYWLDYRYPIGEPQKVTKPDRIGKDNHELYAVKPSPVPKSFKTPRIICPEKAYHAAEMQRARKAAERSFLKSKYGKLYDPSDQGSNRECAWLGSKDGVYATVDLTAASDSIIRSLAFRVFPNEFNEFIREHLPTHFKVGKQLRRMNLYLPSGNPCCFVCESLLFLAIYLTVNELYTTFTGKRALAPHIFGDDACCDAAVYDMAVEVLTRLGFTVNQDKSYGHGSNFRESCGVEYLCGMDVATKYFPRRCLNLYDPSGEDIGSLCSLQHRMYEWWKCQNFLRKCVYSLVPDMTSHVPGTDCFDLWTETSLYVKRSAPHRKSATEIPAEVLLREAHYALVPDDPKYTFNRDIEMYLYTRFLKEGPTVSEDPVLQLLNISERTPRTGLTDSVKTKLRKVTE